MASVHAFDPRSLERVDYSNAEFPCGLLAFDGRTLVTPSHGTSYGFIQRGGAQLIVGSKTFELSEGMYFCAPGSVTLQGEASGFVAVRYDFRGLFRIGGPIESSGRLRYIDGCSDTLLIGPPLLGDPCLNLLHIPPGTRQTAHTHPSERLGIIAAGRGVCKTASGDIDLVPGLIFAIDADGVHSFNTDTDSLLVIAWHPDSDCGPDHDNHPMINRTLVDGISAAQIPEIATQGVTPEQGDADEMSRV